MKKLLLATLTGTLLLGACGNDDSNNDSTKTKDKDHKKETVNKQKKENKKKTSDSKKDISKDENKDNDNITTEEPATTEQASSNSEQPKASSPEQCIMSGLVECEGVTEEQKYTAYKNLVANGTLPQGTPGDGNIEQAVQDSFAIKNGQYNNWQEINKERQAQDKGAQYQQDTTPYEKEYTNDGHEKYNNDFSNDEINEGQANLDALLEEGTITQSEYDQWSNQIRN